MRLKILALIFSTLSLALLFSSCEDKRLDAVVDDKIYALKADYDEVEVFNWGDFNYELTIVKSGAGKQSSEVELVLDESYLAKYNEKHGTAYELLPANCYTLHTSKLSLSKGDYLGKFPITFNSQAIIDLQGGENVKYVLPYYFKVQNESIADTDGRLYTLVSPKVKEPYFLFKNPGKTLGTTTLTPKSPTVTGLSSMVRTVYHNKWNITYDLVIEPSAIDNYNASVEQEELKYKLLPADAYRLLPDTYKLKEKLNEATFGYELLREGLFKDGQHMFGNYMIPIRISSVSQHKIAPGANSLQLITVAYQAEYFDRKADGWEVIECSSQQPETGGGINAILDDNDDTFWHSQWMDEGAGLPPLPHHLVIDMKKEYDVMSLELTRRLYYPDTKKVVFELSSDNVNYENVTSIDFGTGIVEDKVNTLSSHIKTKRARYIRCTVTEGNRPPNASIAEIKVRGTEVE